MIHTTPTKVLLATTLRPVVVPLSGSLAQGVRLIQQCLRDEPTPQKMATCEGELSALLREVGRRMMAWVWNHVEPAHPAAAPSRVQWEGRLGTIHTGGRVTQHLLDEIIHQFYSFIAM